MDSNTDLSQIKVLFVENDPSSLILVKEFAKLLNIDATFCESAEEALELLKNHSYQICFMDVHLPNLDGIEATKIIKKDISDKIKIIGLSASVLPKDHQICLDAGMDDFLPKPVSFDSIKSVIEKNIPK